MKKLGRQIKSKEELICNLHTVEYYLSSAEGVENRDAMIHLIGNGTNFVAYNYNGQMHFAPSRFIGYLNNTLLVHLVKNNGKNGSDTSSSIDKILLSKRKYIDELEKSYLEYCDVIGAIPKNMLNAQRKYWYLEDNIKVTKELFEEGNSEQVSTNRYERSIEARKKAIKYHGLKCVVCGMDFEETYGELGRGFIHIHHIIPISSKGRTKIDYKKDLVPVCPNCHAMLHRGDNGRALSIKELKGILKKRKNDGTGEN